MCTTGVPEDYSKAVVFRLKGLFGVVHHAAGRAMAAADCFVRFLWYISFPAALWVCGRLCTGDF